ncbi:GNAT family N-acetyltransferase [Aurantimonas sp. Leaf443]|uniref:GNAT family N-acetyltransferase n=1 Tax=Aurantimonas sp. Leaf443 TaxID=1736378 RepID=UPI0006F3F23E|nr:GNAT family N-acetyltransferase [Aurantimonas sp. Leaf443]KQT82246.1 hypothetical protein ASG48_16585 [Aurantimonas sp. Leaf443]
MTMPAASVTFSSPAAASESIVQPCAVCAGQTLRRLRPEDVSVLTAHFKRLDPTTRRLRFGNAVNDAFLARYAALALGEDAVVKGVFVDGVLRGVGELRFLDPRRMQGEAAFSLEADFQGRGHGSRLFEGVLLAARNRGVHKLFLTCLRENTRMQKIAARHGADLSFVAGDVNAELRRPYADAASLAAEMAQESEAFVFAMLDWRRSRANAFLASLRRLAGGISPFPARH